MKNTEKTITNCTGIRRSGAKVANGITELVFILDRSGSMSGLEDDTIGGFNSMIERQRGEKGECYVTVVLFDDEIEFLYDRVKLGDVPPMTRKDYFVRGCTALVDAIGIAIDRIGFIHRYARAEDVPEHTVFVITTDGMENASRQYTSDKVKRMIEGKKEGLGWEFLFIGANIDAVETASKYGIDRSRAVKYNADGKGTQIMYKAVSDAVSGYRRCASVSSEWSKDIKEDYEARKEGEREEL